MASLTLSSCGQSSSASVISISTSETVEENGKIKMNYYDELEYNEKGKSIYNNNLFYRNDYVFDLADPGVLRIDDPNHPDYGKFYAFGTTSNIGAEVFRSEDLVNWEGLGYALIATDPKSEKAKVLDDMVWAMEAVWDPEENKYYMFTSSCPPGYGASSFPIEAVADRPEGPYELIKHDDYLYFDGAQIKDTADQFYWKYCTFDPYQILARCKDLGIDYQSSQIYRGLDFHPFVDPETGEKYLYWSDPRRGQFITGIHMFDWRTPDYDSLTCLARPCYSTYYGDQEISYERNNRIDEGPWVNYHNGKYYLTYSFYGAVDRSYSLGQAVSDSPLGEFRKLEESENGVVLSCDEQTRPDVSGTGHHSIVETTDGRIYNLYHEHNDVMLQGWGRHPAVDEMRWVTIEDINGEPLDVMMTNGPTSSIQNLPEFNAEYVNVAENATFTATNVKADSDTSWMHDGMFSCYNYADAGFVEKYVQPTRFDGNTTITIDFDDFRNVRALMVYNSARMESAFHHIKHIEFDFRDKDGKTRTKYIDDLQFDWQSYTSVDDEDVIIPGCAAIAEFNDIDVKEIRIDIDIATPEEIFVAEGELEIPEIKVLGKAN